MSSRRIGSATVRVVHALFTPDDRPVVSVRPEREHAARAATWALRVLGHGHTGGSLVLIAEPGAGARAESLAAVLAVDDAVTGGLAPLLRDPALLRRITAAAGIPLP